MDKGWGQESMGQGSRNKHASVTACDNFIVSGIKSVVQQMKIIIIWGKKKISTKSMASPLCSSLPSRIVSLASS